MYCSSLTSVTIPDSVTSIGGGAFSDCSSLSNITVEPGNSNYSSSDGALLDRGQTKLICCPAGYIGTYTIPNGVTSIENSAFSGCSGLTGVTIPDSVTSIGGSAFYDCSRLTSVTIPDSVTSIGDRAFYGCSSLTSVTIPDKVTGIADATFSGCSSLASVTMPDSVTSIGRWAFQNCSSLTAINFTGTQEQWNAITKGINAIPTTATVYDKDGNPIS